MTEASNAENDAMLAVKYPPGWNAGNADYIASPYAYNSSYINPAYFSPQSGGGADWHRPDMFNSALSQPAPRKALPYQSETNNLAQQNGAGVIDKIQGIHSKVKSGKYISKGLNALAHFKPGAKKYADIASQMGYGRFDQPIGIVPERFHTMPYQKPRQFPK
jgi:hypothetical protein